MACEECAGNRCAAGDENARREQRQCYRGSANAVFHAAQTSDLLPLMGITRSRAGLLADAVIQPVQNVDFLEGELSYIRMRRCRVLVGSGRAMSYDCSKLSKRSVS